METRAALASKAAPAPAILAAAEAGAAWAADGVSTVAAAETGTDWNTAAPEAGRSNGLRPYVRAV